MRVSPGGREGRGLGRLRIAAYTVDQPDRPRVGALGVGVRGLVAFIKAGRGWALVLKAQRVLRRRTSWVSLHACNEILAALDRIGVEDIRAIRSRASPTGTAAFNAGPVALRGRRRLASRGRSTRTGCTASGSENRTGEACPPITSGTSQAINSAERRRASALGESSAARARGHQVLIEFRAGRACPRPSRSEEKPAE